MKKLFAICLIIMIFISVFGTLNVSAAEGNLVFDKVFAISRGGDTSVFPENSIEAIKSVYTLGFDAFSSTVRKTADGEFVLFENETTNGVCVDSNGADINVKIADTKYDTLKSYYLLSTDNPAFKTKTTEHIALLDDVLKETDGKLVMIIDAEEAILNEIYDKVYELGFLNNVIFRCRKMKNEDLLNWANKQTVIPDVIPAYKGNVIFSAVSTYNFAEENKTKFCEFSVKNRYGVIYSQFFANRFNYSLALAPVYDKDLCGQRPDTVLGWENLLKLGYSAIETGNAREFSEYLSLINSSYARLSQTISQLNHVNFDNFAVSYTEFSKRLDEAKAILDSKHATCSDEINTAIENMEIASNELVKADGEKSTGITPMKIFWIIFAVALFVSSQIYLKKKTVK